MEAIREKLWLENNRLSENLFYIKTLAKQKKLRIQETVHFGHEALFLSSGLETYKVVINDSECKLNVLGKNKAGNSKNSYHYVRDFEETDAWFEAIHFIGELIQRSKRGKDLCGKRFYKKQGGYG